MLATWLHRILRMNALPTNRTDMAARQRISAGHLRIYDITLKKYADSGGQYVGQTYIDL